MKEDKSEAKIKLVKYYYENKEWLEELARHGDPYIQAMALTITKNALEE